MSISFRSVTSLPFPRVGVCNRNMYYLDKLPPEADPGATNVSSLFPPELLTGDWIENYTAMAHPLDDMLLEVKGY